MGTVVDGEICAWNGDRLDFDLLQRRLVGRRRRVAELSAAAPVAFMAFDLLAARGLDLRGEPLRDRWTALGNLARSWAAPQRAPTTDSADLAMTRMNTLRPAGIEGIVAKSAASKYLPGARGRIKAKSRETTEIIIGAVTDPIDKPTSIITGVLRADGTLTIVGRSTPLATTQAPTLATQLAAAVTDHPWPTSIIVNRLGAGRDLQQITRVQPQLVAEVTADTACGNDGIYRHPGGSSVAGRLDQRHCPSDPVAARRRSRVSIRPDICWHAATLR